ncbi:MAG: hypothetical protein ACR2NX_16345 [Chthoniobacterales bacterium]
MPPRGQRKRAHGAKDAIRIVPLHLPATTTEHLRQFSLDDTVTPLTYRGGPLLTAVEVFTVFWGSGWKKIPETVTALNDFFPAILPLLTKQLAEYSVPQFKIGDGHWLGSVSLTKPALKKSVTDAAIQEMLQAQTSSNKAFPQPGPNVLYFVYLAPGVRVTQGGSASCLAFCGYHDQIGGKIFYAVMPYPNCQGCLGALQPLAALTSTSSHELCEAITDPIPGQGWYNDTAGEIGDICAWKTKPLGGYTVQLEWSNQAKKCV